MQITDKLAWRHHEFLKIGFALLVVTTVIGLLFWFIDVALPYAPEPIGSRANLFIEGARLTLVLSLVSGAFGLLIGLGVGLARLSSKMFLKVASSGFVALMRGTPLLVQIFFVYYALPVLVPSLRLSEFTASMIALALNVGAYNAEAIRAGILALPKGQSEAARSLGMSHWKTMRWVILPQSLKIVTPPLLNNWVALLKDSSLASSIGLLELTLAGSRITSETFLPVPVLATVATIYLLLTLVITLAASLLERGSRFL